jgi:beta-lactamase regulating signal transducer with metallopeptidase domain
MLISELICIVHWFNPFVWMLKKSMRQNLEYLTDDIMLQKGTDATEYQYLLVRSVQEGALRFALTFNYHSLKSRIIMINSLKSNPLHRFKFLLLTPLLLFVLFAFRSASR